MSMTLSPAVVCDKDEAIRRMIQRYHANTTAAQRAANSAEQRMLRLQRGLKVAA